LDERRVILIEASAVGFTGWGEAAPVPGHTRQTDADLWSELTTAGRAALESSTDLLGAAYAGALADLEARSSGRPLWSRLGAAATVWASAAIGVTGAGAPDRRLLETAAASGYRFAKLKVTPATTPLQVAAAIEAYPTIRFGADANGSLGNEEPLLRALDGMGLAYIEQPGPIGDLEFHSRLRMALETPISLDESAATPGSVARIIAAAAADIVNLKVGRFGPAATLRLAGELVEAGLGARLGGLIETGVGRAHTVALASHGPFPFVGDIAGSDRYFTDDLVRPQWRLHDGRLPLPGGPGIGVTVDNEAVAAHTIASLRLC
jgi:O-succinylbenzoate synthase